MKFFQILTSQYNSIKNFEVAGVITFKGQVAAATFTPYFEYKLKIGLFSDHFHRKIWFLAATLA